MRRSGRIRNSSSLESTDPLDRIVDDLMARLDLRACWYEPFPFDTLLPRIEEEGITAPTDEPGVRRYREWQPPDGVELPIRFGGLTLGRFVLVRRVLTWGVLIPPGQRTDALALAHFAGDELHRRWTGAPPPRESAENQENPRV